MYLPDSEMTTEGSCGDIELLLWGEVTDPRTQMEFGLVDASYGEDFVNAASPAYFLPAYILSEPYFPATRDYLVVINPMLVGQMTIELIRLMCTMITVNCVIARRETQLLDLRIGAFKGDPNADNEPPYLGDWFTSLHEAIPYLALFLKESCLKDYISQVSESEQENHTVIAHIYGCVDRYIKKSFSGTPKIIKAIEDSATQRMDTVLRNFLPKIKR
jgi:hypothetical protein